MKDEKIVNAEQPSVEETVSTEAQTLPEGEVAPPQFLTKEQVLELMTEERERIKQSSRDIAKAEIVGAQRRATDSERRAKFAEDSLARVRGRYGELDPEARQVLETEDLRARVQAFEGRQQRDAIERQQAESAQSLNQALLDHLSDLGIDPKDERIDWGHDATSLPEGLRRFNKSVAKIAKEDVKDASKRAEQDAKDKLAQERKEAGLDSADTGIPAGVSKGIPTHMEAFRKWVKGLSTEEYQAKKGDIQDMLDRGQIK